MNYLFLSEILQIIKPGLFCLFVFRKLVFIPFGNKLSTELNECWINYGYLPGRLTPILQIWVNINEGSTKYLTSIRLISYFGRD